MASASKNILWLSVSRVAALLLLFVAYAQLFRYLGPHASGQYQFVLSFVTIFGIIVDFGIQQYVIKKISEQPEKAKQYFHNFLAVEAVLVVLIYAAIVMVGWLGHYETLVFRAILVAGLGTALNGLTYPFLAVMSSFYDLKKVAFINFMNSVINVGIIFIAIYSGLGIVFLASNQVIFALLGLVLYYQFIKAHIPQPDIGGAIVSLDSKLVRSIFKAALPFALLVGFSTVYNRIDVVLITHFLGYTETGFYTAAYKFFDLLGFFPAVVSHSLYPVFASLMARGAIPEIRLTLERYLRFLMAVAIPMAVGGMLLAKEIILVLAGPEYLAAAPTLAILVWAPAILFVYIVVNSIVISQLTKFAVIITSANVAVNIIGNLILLPRFGIQGAAIMTIVSELLQGVFYFYFVRKKITSFRFWSFLWRPAIAAAVMGGVLAYTRPLLFAIADRFGGMETAFSAALFLGMSVILGAGIYFVVLMVLRFFQPDDIAAAKQLLKFSGKDPSAMKL
jgi:O-antigen/teichoic acid export membrane protein